MPTNPTLPHKPKQNNCIKLFYTRNDRMKKKQRKKQARKKERRREKKEKRKKEEGSGRSRRGLASPDLAGSHQRLHGDPLFFFFFFFPVVGLAASPRRRSAQTPRGDPPRKKSTTGHRDPRLGLAGRGFGFFLVLG
jgi:hypothetical protein